MGFFTSNEMSRKKFMGSSICHYEITKDDVKSNNFTKLDDFMKSLKIYYSPVARQKVLFTFAYDDDKRELIYIPEVIKYAKEIINRHPYFWYYSTTYNSEFFCLAELINLKNYTIFDMPANRKVHIEQDPENLKRLVYKIGGSLEKFGMQIKDPKGCLESLKIWGDLIMSHTNTHP